LLFPIHLGFFPLAESGLALSGSLSPFYTKCPPSYLIFFASTNISHRISLLTAGAISAINCWMLRASDRRRLPPTNVPLCCHWFGFFTTGCFLVCFGAVRGSILHVFGC
jgi:hypothetical protein